MLSLRDKNMVMIGGSRGPRCLRWGFGNWPEMGVEHGLAFLYGPGPSSDVSGHSSRLGHPELNRGASHELGSPAR
jgi:hypothetical protein